MHKTIARLTGISSLLAATAAAVTSAHAAPPFAASPISESSQVKSGTLVAPSQAPSFKVFPPIFIPVRNPNHYLLLDKIHYVATELGMYTPESTSIPTRCAWLGTFFCMADKGADFSADFGDGIDIGSAKTVWLDEYKDAATNTIYPQRIFMIDFDRKPSVSLMHLTGFVDYAPPNNGQVTVKGSVNFGFALQAIPAGWLELALQTQDEAGNWSDYNPYGWRTVAGSPYADDTRGHTGLHSLTVYASVPAFTAVRLELRGGQPTAADENVRISGAQLLIGECVPDANNPGQCL